MFILYLKSYNTTEEFLRNVWLKISKCFFPSILQHFPNLIPAKLFGNRSYVLSLILEIYFSHMSQAITPPYISEEFYM